MSSGYKSNASEADARAPKSFSPKSRFGPIGVAAVLGVHALIGYALVSGVARKAVEAVQRPLMASIVPEVVPPPPPPPPSPPRIERLVERVRAPEAPPKAYVPPPDNTPALAAAPSAAIAAVQSESVPVSIPAPTPPQTPTSIPARPSGPVDVGVACPGYRQALESGLAGLYERVGIAGSVKVQFKVRGGTVVDITTLSGPREYARTVQSVVRRFNCLTDGAEEAIVVFDVSFRSE